MAPAAFALSLGGQFKPGPASTHYVSIWHLPGGVDVNNARTVEVYFDDLESAKQFEQKYKAAPEMACISPYPLKSRAGKPTR